MTIAKRLFIAFSAFALCAAISLGSLSFMPKASAIDDYTFETLPFPNPSHPYYFCTGYTGGSLPSGVYALTLVESDSSFNVEMLSDILCFNNSVTGQYYYVTTYRSDIGLNTGGTGTGSGSRYSYFFTRNASFGSPFPYLISDGVRILKSPSTSFNYSVVKPPISEIPRFSYFSPFYFPEMPHGYFDGNINVVDGSYSIDFPSNASISGAITQTGNDHYTWTWNHGTLYWNGETVQGEHEGWISPDYQHQTPPIGDITQTAYANRLINLSLSDLDSVVNYTPAYDENSRFRCWSCVMDSSYVWFISDTRNKITGSIVSVTSDEVIWKYEFSDPQGGNTIYPICAIVFSPMGEVIQVLSPTLVSNKNTYTLSCSIGTLEQAQDTGIWSCDPLYHGFWFSDDSPPVANITLLNVGENKKYLANPVFGESAFQLQFLDSINRGIADINSNIQSLQSAMQSSISGQTSDFQNMDAPSAPQPSTSQMMDYFSKESAFSAPNTDEVFSGDIKSGHYWDGVTWWSTKFNDIIVSNQVIVAFTTAMLTLGLAVLIIGRRFSMR